MEKSFEFENFDLRGFFNLSIKSVHFFGYFPPDFKEKYKLILYRCYAVVIIGFMFVTCLITQLGGIMVVFGDIAEMADASFLALTNIAQLSKLYPFIFKADTVRKIINSVNRDLFKPRNREQHEILVEDITVAKRNSKIFAVMCFLTCCLWGVFPLFDEVRRLPLGGWFPYDTENSPIFEITYLYQVITAMVNGLGCVCMDTFLMAVIMVISAQLKVLSNSLKNMKQRQEIDNTKVKQAEKEVRMELIRNVEHYKEILGYAEEINDLFTFCIMVQFCSSVLVSCITLLQLSLVPVASIQFVSMLSYEACMLLQIYLWCYYGNEVIFNGEKLTESAYMSEWVDCCKEFKKDLLFFMTRTQVTLHFTAGGYFILSLSTYMALVKSSWSYYAILHQVNSK